MFLVAVLCMVFVLTPRLNGTFVKTILELFVILFIPGYSLIAALFPRKDDLEDIERTALSFGLSVTITPLIGLALHYTIGGIRLNTLITFTLCINVYNDICGFTKNYKGSSMKKDLLFHLEGVKTVKENQKAVKSSRSF